MPQSLASVYVHVVFSTKQRMPFLTPELRAQLYPYLGGTALGAGTKVLAVGGMPDHVHMLVSFGREVTIAETVKTLKGGSSRWVHDRFPSLPFQWQSGYGAFSIGFRDLDALRSYIANQESHHAYADYQCEFRGLLRDHGVEWDEKYVWD